MGHVVHQQHENVDVIRTDYHLGLSFSLSICFTWNITRVSVSSCLHCNCCAGSCTTDPFSMVYLCHWSSNAKCRECPDKIWTYSCHCHSQMSNLSNADLIDGDSNVFCYSVGRLYVFKPWYAISCLTDPTPVTLYVLYRWRLIGISDEINSFGHCTQVT